MHWLGTTISSFRDIVDVMMLRLISCR